MKMAQHSMRMRKNTAKRWRPVVTTEHSKADSNDQQQEQDAQKRTNKRVRSLCSKDVCGAPGEKKSIFYLMYTMKALGIFAGFPRGPRGTPAGFPRGIPAGNES